MTQRNCPTCDTGMANGRMGPVRVDICVPCGGTWLEEGALPALAQGGPLVLKTLCEKVRSLRQPAAGHQTHAPRCPGCQVPLVATEFASMPGIRLYTCSFCRGFWLDTGALTGLLTRLTPATPQPGQDTRQVQPRPAESLPPPVPIHTPPASAAGGPKFTPPPANIWGGPATAPTAAVGAKPAAKAGGAPESNVCPGCKETNPKSAPVCWACGHMLQSKVVGQCPRCTSSLHDAETEDVHISACQACAGTLLDDKRLTSLMGLPEQYQKRLLAAIQKIHTGRATRHLDVLHCPHCKINMIDAPLGMMTREPVYVCPSCEAIFMDGGVLDRVLWAR